MRDFLFASIVWQPVAPPLRIGAAAAVLAGLALFAWRRIGWE